MTLRCLRSQDLVTQCNLSLPECSRIDGRDFPWRTSGGRGTRNRVDRHSSAVAPHAVFRHSTAGRVRPLPDRGALSLGGEIHFTGYSPHSPLGSACALGCLILINVNSVTRYERAGTAWTLTRTRRRTAGSAWRCHVPVTPCSRGTGSAPLPGGCRADKAIFVAREMGAGRPAAPPPFYVGFSRFEGFFTLERS